MDEILYKAIRKVEDSNAAWCQYITGNDAGVTGSHQVGYYLPKAVTSVIFDTPVVRGENKERVVNIKWQDDFITESRFKYYGVGTRNEFRVTRFGRGFPFLQDTNVGSLLVFAKCDYDNFEAFVLSSDDQIDTFLSYFALPPHKVGKLIEKGFISKEDALALRFWQIAEQLQDFPTTIAMSQYARECYNSVNHISKNGHELMPDDLLLGWLGAEYRLFQEVEAKLYQPILSQHFSSVDEFLKKGLEISNRRKARAGKSLEIHLGELFTHNNLLFESQGITENKKRPDFLFPDSESYQNFAFPTDQLVILGAKTSCKDRWRQILSEADRVESKHLFTLQQGISRDQLHEMYSNKLTLVVPNQHINSFPKEFRSQLLSLSSFIAYVREKQSNRSH